MEISNSICEGEIVVIADAEVFSKEAVIKCLYWYGDKFNVSISSVEGNKYSIRLSPLSNANLTGGDLEIHCQKIKRDLIDFQLRQIIATETKNIRDLLVAKAFSNGDFDQSPEGEISDPVGFDPTAIR
jgi:His-Xaa-Ser system protein HxsD